MRLGDRWGMSTTQLDGEYIGQQRRSHGLYCNRKENIFFAMSCSTPLYKSNILNMSLIQIFAAGRLYIPDNEIVQTFLENIPQLLLARSHFCQLGSPFT